ncbi:hypothetical protein Q8F55_005614 [Vanrija albida]|uniref:Major facilitator superfamily (MFS) profile domain-containing protein n=1 Tax=Vanrija albida TaxID=181172 RepID=A0ABR3Q2C6_9TREE
MISKEAQTRIWSVAIVIVYTAYAMWALAVMGRYSGLATFGPVCALVFFVVLFEDGEKVSFPPPFTHPNAGKAVAWTAMLVTTASLVAGWYSLCEVNMLGIALSHNTGLLAMAVLFFVETNMWPGLASFATMSPNRRKVVVARAIQFGWLPIAVHYALTYHGDWTLPVIGMVACVMCALGGAFAEYYTRREAEHIEEMRASLPLVNEKAALPLVNEKGGDVETAVEKPVTAMSTRYAICIAISFVTTLLSAIVQSRSLRSELPNPL